MKKVTKAQIKDDIIEFAYMVKEEYLPDMLRYIEDSQESQDALAPLVQRYGGLEATTKLYLAEDFVIEN